MAKTKLKPKNSKNAEKVVLITGGASGIGFCTAMEFAQDGYTVLISDINKLALSKAAQKLKKTGAIVETYQVDVSDRKAVQMLAEEIKQDFDGVDILVNNAGIGFNGEIIETTFKDWERLLNINFWGVLNHIYAFLPSMMKRRSGQICNISSGQAFARLPTWGAYSTVKLAVAGLSEVLSFELKKFNIHVTTVFPFMVNTGFYDTTSTDTFGAKLSMKLLPYYSQKPESVAKIIKKAILKKKHIEMVHPLNQLFSLSRALPGVSSMMSKIAISFLGKKAEDHEVK